MPYLASPERSTRSGQAPKSIFPGSPLLVLLAIAVIALAVAWSDRVPAPLGMEAPAGAFSAGRALAVLGRLAGRGEPRPLGSAGHERSKDFLLAALKELGYAPELQEAVSYEPWSGNVARVQNVLARLEGRESGAVMVTAHYDTVAAGPGAADDGIGVAVILELARIFKQESRPRHSVIFLFADGEESGMLGARAFTAEHPWARDVRTVLNIDSAGTNGRALMYETSAGNHWITGGWRRAVTRPYGSSTMYELYKLMPNNSDLTVYKEAGLAGLNFANIGNPSGYHTSLDDLAHASAGTLQDMGDQVLACTRYFANAEPPAARQGDDVYFDLFGLSAIAYPRLFAWLLALCATGMTVAGLIRLGRRVDTGERNRVGTGLIAYPLGALAGAAGGMSASSLIKALTESLGPVYPAVAMAATAGLSLAAALTVYVLFARRAGRFGLLGGVLIWWNLYTLLTTVFVTGASYLWVWPCIGAAGWLFLAAARRTETSDLRWAPLLAVVPAALLWLPLLLFSPLLLSGPLRPLAVLPCSFLLSLAAPVLADGGSWGRPRLRWLLPAVAVGVGSICAVSILWSPPGNTERVQGHWLGYHLDTDLGRGFWIAPPGTPAPVRRALGRTDPTVFWGEKVLSAPAPAMTLPAPKVTVTADDVGPDNRRILKVRVESPRRARDLHIEFAGGAAPVAVRLNGREYALPYRHLGFIGLPPEGMEIELIGATGTPWRATVSDLGNGLPAGGERLLRARPDWAVPCQEGDGTVVTRKVNL